eukprot:XP_028342732.1 uncharacterized protein LOC114485467 [Physeter catodon]
MPLPAVPLLAFQASPVPGGQPGPISAPQESAPGPGTRKPLPVRPREGPGAHCRPRWGDQVDADGRSGLPGRKSWSLAVWALAPPGPREFWVQSSPFLGSWSRGAERAPRTLLSPGSGRSGFSEPPVSLGVKLPLLPREAHRRAEAALGLRLRSVNRAAPAAICSRVGDSEIFTPSSQRQPHACGTCSRVERKAGPATSGTPRGAPRPPPGEDLVEEDRLRVAYPEGAASRASEPPARTAPGTTPSCSYSVWRWMVQAKNGLRSSGTQGPLPSSVPAQPGSFHPHIVSESKMAAGVLLPSPHTRQQEGGVKRGAWSRILQ